MTERTLDRLSTFVYIGTTLKAGDGGLGRKGFTRPGSEALLRFPRQKRGGPVSSRRPPLNIRSTTGLFLFHKISGKVSKRLECGKDLVCLGLQGFVPILEYRDLSLPSFPDVLSKKGRLVLYIPSP